MLTIHSSPAECLTWIMADNSDSWHRIIKPDEPSPPAPGTGSDRPDGPRLTGVQGRYTPCLSLMKTKNIRHRVVLPARPRDVFTTLLDSKLHSQFTEEFANIDARPGGSFTCYGDYITGITIELEPNECIIQAWRSRNWSKGTYSIISIRLAAKPDNKTELRFSQIGVPADDYADKNKGWRTHYWEPLRRFLRRHKRSDS
jgi:activator of HSP90 ATPase